MEFLDEHYGASLMLSIEKLKEVIGSVDTEKQLLEHPA